MELLPWAMWVHWRQAVDSYQCMESGRECGKKILDPFIGWFRSLLPRPLSKSFVCSHVDKWGEECQDHYIVEGGGGLSSWLFSSFLFLLFFLSVFNCHLYFLWESRHLLSKLRGTVHGKDKEKMNIFCSPWVSSFVLPLPPFLIIHLYPFSLFTYPLISLLMSHCYS